MSTFLVIVFVLALALVAAFIVLVFSMAALSKRREQEGERAAYYAWLRQQFYEDSVRLAAMPQGHPTDEEENDMAIRAEYGTVHVNLDYSPDTCAHCPFDDDDADACDICPYPHQSSHYRFTIVVICPLCGHHLIHRIEQDAYVQLTMLDTAVQHVDGMDSVVLLSKFCSDNCVEHATQGAGFEFEWYPCRSPWDKYICNPNTCKNDACRLIQ